MVDDGDGQSLQSKLQALELMFASRLPGKLLELRQTMNKCLDDEPDPVNLEDMHRLLHSLAGSAGIFGFRELGERTRVLELAFKPLAGLPEWPSLQLPEMSVALDELLLWAAQHAKASVPQAGAGPADASEPHAAQETRLIHVVERDAQLEQDIAAQLTHYGFTVQLMRDLAALQTAMAERIPDAVVIDLGFADGELVGSQEIARIRAQTSRNIPVIFISNTNQFDMRLAAVRFGYSGYFPKPVDLLALADRLDQLTRTQEVEPYRVLIIDDDPDSAMHYGVILREADISVRLLHYPAEILQTLGEFMPELILMDMVMPTCSGLEMAAMVRQDDRYLDVPIVFLSSEDDWGVQMAAIRSGADEFLSKAIVPEHLVSAVASRIERYRKLRNLIGRDGLTGLFKHASGIEQLGREVARARRTQGSLSIAMIDLDYFKSVNERYGHPVGDQVLRALARLLYQRLRRGDISCRHGGEEFVIIFPETGVKTAVMVLDRIREAFSRIVHYADQEQFSVTFSAAVVELGRNQDVASLVASADQVLSQAKERGRNCIVGQDAEQNLL
jgi:diguanylate cyclase (GGDEF)-like protein